MQAPRFFRYCSRWCSIPGAWPWDKEFQKLKDILIETDPTLLQDSYPYKTEYKVDFSSFPPHLEQTKYIMVPVHNDWGNNERSLMQEHIIGSRNYALSYGEPEEQKVYSLVPKRVIQK